MNYHNTIHVLHLNFAQVLLPSMVFLLYRNEVIVFLLDFVLTMQYLSKIQKIWYGTQTIQGYLEWGIAHSLNILFYELEYNMH